MLQLVLKYFEEIAEIPHGSGNTKKISEYCVNFAKSHGLDFYTDELGNVIIYVPGTEGYQDHPGVILQGHLDMVCDKDLDVEFDFTKDPLKLQYNDGFLSATGTTLGGDDGIAIAMCLAIVEADVPHPPLEVVFTVDEETGMYGANGIDASQIHYRRLINIDSEEEGVITAGCAGGARLTLTVPMTPELIPDEGDDDDCYRITVSGLIGGHSGADIDKGRLNSNVVMGDFLKYLISHEYGIRMISIEGGDKDNVIPNRTVASLFAFPDICPAVLDFLADYQCSTEPDICISIDKISAPNSLTDEETGETLVAMYSKDNTDRILELLGSVPNGITAMSKDIEGLVETSLNFASIRTTLDSIKLKFLIRSSVDFEKKVLIAKLQNIAENFRGETEVDGEYAAWEYNSDSPLRDKFVSVYEKINGEKPVVNVIHAGLECGILADKLSGLDAISIGPNIIDIHTPRERLDIASTERTISLLTQVLEEL